MNDTMLSLFSDEAVTREERKRVETVRPGPALARSTDPETSHAAAASISDVHEQAILAVFAGELTDDELCTRLPEYHAPSIKSARSRLAKAGLLEDSGQRRPSDRGRRMIVWRLAS